MHTVKFLHITHGIGPMADVDDSHQTRITFSILSDLTTTAQA
jgi:hypothetical protein